MTDTYYDLHNRHEVYIQRYASYLRNEYPYKNLQEVYKLSRLILLDAEEINNLTERSKVVKAIQEAIEPPTNAMWAATTEELDQFAAQEAAYYASMFGAVNAVDLSVPATKKILNYINRSVMRLDPQKGVWSTFTKRNTRSIYKAYEAEVIKGYGNGETVNQMVKRIRAVTNGVLKNQADALVRTGTAHYAEGARQAMTNDNLDIITGEFPNVTFDNRTTDICISISARYPEGWEVNKSPIGYPPYHFNCRTTLVRLTGDQKRPDGTKASVSGKKGEEAEKSFDNRNTRLKNRRNNPDNTTSTPSQVRRNGNKDKAFKGGQIDGGTPFSKFLKSQPTWYIYDTLGKDRGQLFLDGKLDLKNLTDKNLKPLTLKQLGEK